MAYMNKNVNMMLLVLVLVVVVSLVLLTTVFQQNYKNLSQSYESTATELSKVKSNFTQKLQDLNKTTTQLQITSGDKKKLDTLYGDLSSERERLDKELADTVEALREAQSALSEALYRVVKQEEEITDLNRLVTNLKAKVKELQDDNCNLHKQINSTYNCQ